MDAAKRRHGMSGRDHENAKERKHEMKTMNSCAMRARWSVRWECLIRVFALSCFRDLLAERCTAFSSRRVGTAHHNRRQWCASPTLRIPTCLTLAAMLSGGCGGAKTPAPAAVAAKPAAPSPDAKPAKIESAKTNESPKPADADATQKPADEPEAKNKPAPR